MKLPTPTGAIREIKELRRTRTKVFDMGGGKRKVSLGIAPVHYDAGGGDWQEVDPTWTQEGDGSFTLSKVSYGLTVPADRIAYTYTAASNGSQADVVLARIGGTLVGDMTLNIAPEIVGSAIVWRNVDTQLNLRLVATDSGVVFHHILKGPLAARVFVHRVTQDADFPAPVVATLPERGRDNDNNDDDVERVMQVDRRRRLELMGADRRDLPSIGGRVRYTLRTGWTGRVKRLQTGTRIRSFSDRVMYPVVLI